MIEFVSAVILLLVFQREDADNSKNETTNEGRPENL